MVRRELRPLVSLPVGVMTINRPSASSSSTASGLARHTRSNCSGVSRRSKGSRSGAGSSSGGWVAGGGAKAMGWAYLFNKGTGAEQKLMGWLPLPIGVPWQSSLAKPDIAKPLATPDPLG